LTISPKKFRYFAAAVALGVATYAVIAIVSLNDGHDWGGDFSLYIAHAINIATDRPYTETRYIPNQLYPLLSPTFYPPVTPLVLAPVYAIFGLDLVAMKAILVLFFCAAMLIIFLHYRRHVGPIEATLVVIATGLNPQLWYFKENIGSEYLFLFFVFLSLLLLDVRERVTALSSRLLVAGAAGITAYLAIATREIGIVLIPAVILYDLLHRRRLGLDSVLFILLILCGNAAQSSLFDLSMSRAYDGGHAGYDAILFGWSNVFKNLPDYIYSLGRLFPVSNRDVYLIPFMAILFIFGVLGGLRELTRYVPRGQHVKRTVLIAEVMRGVRLQDIFVVGYLLAVTLQPFNAGVRYLLPLVPIVVFYVLAGMHFAVQRLMRVTQRFPVIVLIGILAYHVGYYLTAEPLDTSRGIHHPQSIQLFDAVRTQLPKNAIVIFRKPRVMALYAQRRSAVWPKAADERLAWQNLAQLGATHLVIPYGDSGLDYPDYFRFDQWSPNFLEPGFANEHFVIYHILRYPLPEELRNTVSMQIGP
jgi:hypothetical protein